MSYNPNSMTDRRQLAAALCARLTECGFTPVTRQGTKEAIYSRPVDGTDGTIKVLVYTSVVPVRGGGFAVRKEGKDAIRVCAVYTAKDGKERGIARADKRVNRTGTIEATVERTYQRMRDVYKAGMSCDRCSCGAPKFRSKAGNEVCADLCWLSDEERSRPAGQRRKRPASHWRSYNANRPRAKARNRREQREWVRNDIAREQRHQDMLRDMEAKGMVGTRAYTMMAMAGPNPSPEEAAAWNAWKDGDQW